MKKYLTPQHLRSLVIILLVVGLVVLALSGFLTPLFDLSLSPFISVQSWISERYLALQDFLSSPKDMATLTQQNAQLESEVAQLQSEVVSLQEKLSQTEVLYSLLDFARTNPQHKYKAATVIGREISPYLQYIIIDIGSNAGIRHGMPVVTEQGLIGRIDAVIGNAARVQLISDSSSRVNVRLKNANVEAQVRGSVTGEITLEMVPQDVEVAVGEVVITSGLGGNYPPNLFVGQVLSMQSKQNTLFQSGAIQPVVDFNSLNAVLVITNFTAVDISPLEP